MSGHSKWSTIKHQKGKQDAKRGRIFTKLIKEISIAAREGGGDPDANPRLRTAIASAKSANMPTDNIEKAIKRGTGDLPGVNYEEVRYEAYGPAGVAIIIEVVTDNKNRTVAELRHMFSRLNGSLGETGCVSWMFDWKGLISIPNDGKLKEEELFEMAIEAGGDDLKIEDDYFYIYTEVEDMVEVKENLEKNGVVIESAEISAIPQTTVKLDAKDAEKLFKLIDALEDHDDIQKVHANFEVDDEVLENYRNSQD